MNVQFIIEENKKQYTYFQYLVKKLKKVLSRFELELLDSKSNVLTATL